MDSPVVRGLVVDPLAVHTLGAAGFQGCSHDQTATVQCDCFSHVPGQRPLHGGTARRAPRDACVLTWTHARKGLKLMVFSRRVERHEGCFTGGLLTRASARSPSVVRHGVIMSLETPHPRCAGLRDIHLPASALIVDNCRREADEISSVLAQAGILEVGRSDGSQVCSTLASTHDLAIIEAGLARSPAWVACVRNSRRAPFVLVTSRRAARARVAELLLTGADGYLEKPFTASDLAYALGRVDGRADCGRTACKLVGRLGLKEAQEHLRHAMNREALRRTGGSKRAAARLLGITRRYVQLMLEQ